ncbi:hypothetical protein [Bryobacter aggregatus]|uniref:hypothetical protein n=1 Tax=Bryobacter aggregatus TaxID=360054 RepID=UPI0004E1641D|nr:hypothetical protein [Bryobacter aggregatus]
MILSLLFLIFAAQSLEEIRNLPDAEKRYQAALALASANLDEARLSSTNGTTAVTKEKLEMAAEATELSLKSLEAMGKRPYQNTRNYKRAELRTREFLRRIDTLLKDASVEDRDALQSAHERVNAVHEALIEGVMSKKK